MKQSVVVIAVFAAVMAALPGFLGDNPYIADILITILMMASLASAWNIVGGYAGQFSFGHAAYFGAGAYTTSILLTTLNPGIPVSIAAGVLVSCVIALLTGTIVFRLRGHYFALASIAVAEIVRLTVLNLDITGGAQGILVTNVSFGSLDLNSKVPFYYAMLFLLLVTLGISALIRRSRTGYYLLAIREDQDAAASLGINLYLFKNIALVISAAIASVAGSIYAVYISFIDTGTVLPLRLSIEIILTTIIGGIGTLWGPVLGAVLLVSLAEALRSNLIGEYLVNTGIVSEGSATGAFLKSNLAHAHVLVYGIITVLCILGLPKGILGFFSRKGEA
jgi:branched-chain amino acid transport system permease protein